jgi:hypothetical protein
LYTFFIIVVAAVKTSSISVPRQRTIDKKPETSIYHLPLLLPIKQNQSIIPFVAHKTYYFFILALFQSIHDTTII